MTRKHPWSSHTLPRRSVTPQPDFLTPDDALRRVANGSPWVVHWCGAPSTSSADDSAARHLGKVREYQRFVGPAERERMVAKAERKGRTHTVLLRRAVDIGAGH